MLFPQVSVREPHQVHLSRRFAAVARPRPPRAQREPSGWGRPARLLLPTKAAQTVSLYSRTFLLLSEFDQNVFLLG